MNTLPGDASLIFLLIWCWKIATMWWWVRVNFSGRVSYLWFGFGKFPLKIPNFSIFTLGVKKTSLDWVKNFHVKDKSASYLLQFRSMLGSGQGPSLLPRLEIEPSTLDLSSPSGALDHSGCGNPS